MKLIYKNVLFYVLFLITDAQIIINNVQISFENRGTKTDFTIKTNFQLKNNSAGSINLNNVWIGIGFNSAPVMVNIFI